MSTILNFLNSNSPAISATTLIVGGFWAVLKFREYLKDKRFKIYHEELINELVNEQKQPGKIIKLDRQIAIIFELRNFPSYYPVTKRILTDLKDLWKEQPRAVREIEITLDFISRNWFIRTWRRFLKS